MPQQGRAHTEVTHQSNISLWQQPFLSAVQFSGEIKVGQDKGMLPALGDFVSRSFQLNCRIVSPSPLKEKEKEKIAIYRENKILSHGLYNWAYTLFTAQSLIQKKRNSLSQQKTNRHSSFLFC